MEEFNESLILAATGMITVFVILGLVVVVGNLLIGFVNRFVPAPVADPDRPASGSLESKKIAAITAAVEFVTMGKGKITEIKKLDS